MKKVLKLRPFAAVCALLSAMLLAPFQPIAAQRSRLVTPPVRDIEGTPTLPAGTQVLPEGTTLVLEMDTYLQSNRSRVSDRFQATVATPIQDANGRTLIQQGTVVEGHVTNVQPAKWRSRSGVIGISFDYIVLDGRRTPIRGALTAADERTRRQMDQEGNIKGSRSLKRTFLFVGGGAGSGATVAAIAGTGILAATGIGAAAGLTATLLMKGKDAVVEEGQRFGLELTSPLRIGPAWYSTQGRQATTLPVRQRGGSGDSTLRPIIPDTTTGGTLRPTPRPRPSVQGPALEDPNSIRTTGGYVTVYDVRTERSGDGYLRVLVSGETPTSGWRLYTHHQVTNNDTLEVRLRGWPPSNSGLRQVSHPSASTIIVQDRNSAISRVVVHGAGAARTVGVNNAGTTYSEPYRPQQPPQQQQQQQQQQTEPYRPPRPGDLASDGSSINLGVPPYGSPGAQRPSQPQNPPSSSSGSGSSGGGQPTTLSALATRVANDLEVFHENYTASVGLFRNSNRTYDVLGSRRPTANERQMVDSINYLIESAREIARDQNGAQSRRALVGRMRDDFAVANQLWQRISASPEMNRRWQTVQQSVQNLLNAANR